MKCYANTDSHPSQLPGVLVKVLDPSPVPEQIGVPRNRRKVEPRELTEAQVEGLVELYLGGCSQQDAATRFGLHKAAVRRILDQRGVPRRSKKPSGLRVDEATELYLDGWSLRRIGARFSVSAETVGGALRASGIEVRPPGRHPRHA